jgi:hypothetical protein
VARVTGAEARTRDRGVSPASSATATAASDSTDKPASEGSQFFKAPYRYDPSGPSEEYDLTPVSHPGASGKSSKSAVPASSPQAKVSATGKTGPGAPSRKLVNVLWGVVAALAVSNIVTFALLLSRGGDDKAQAALPSATAGAAKAPPRPAAPTPTAATVAPAKPSPSPASVAPGKPAETQAAVAVVAPRKLSATPGTRDNNSDPRVLVPHPAPMSLVVKRRMADTEQWRRLDGWPAQDLTIPGAAQISFEADTSAPEGGLRIKARPGDELNKLVQGPRSQTATLRIAALKRALDSCQVRIEDASGHLLAEFHFVLVAPS